MKDLITRPPPFDLANGFDKLMILLGQVRTNRIRIVVLAIMIAGTTSWAQDEPVSIASDYYTSGGASLSWTAPGDDGNVGTATVYDLRYHTSPITALTFASANKASNLPIPMIAGTTQGCFINRLLPHTVYYFAIKAVDEAGNWSAMSTVLAKSSQDYIVGDANDDTRINIADITYLINYIFNDGGEPRPWGAGDANCDGTVSIADITFLVNYIFKSGTIPGANCP